MISAELGGLFDSIREVFEACLIGADEASALSSLSDVQLFTV